MFLKSLVALLPVVGQSLAVNLYVSSYAGNLTTLSLQQNPDSSYRLTQTTTFNTSTNTPSWLLLNRQNNVLYMIDEANAVNGTNGTVVSYKTSFTGHLTEIQRVKSMPGGLHAAFYGSGSALAIPHYAGSALLTYDISSTGHITPSQTFTYTLPGPGPVPSRQDAPHLHEAILDPTQQYVLVPDLGADLVRIYAINQKTNILTVKTPLKAKAGSGPRHGAFTLDPIAGHYVFYLVAEIASSVTAYRVTYEDALGGLTFDEIGVYSSLSPGEVIPATTTGENPGVVAEVAVSPDGSNLLVSNRRDLTFNNTTPHSDAMSVFSISPTDGTLSFLEVFPAGGSWARQFALNRGGNLVAVGLQETGSVSILERDTTTGILKKEVASIAIGGGQVTCVVWDE